MPRSTKKKARRKAKTIRLRDHEIDHEGEEAFQEQVREEADQLLAQAKEKADQLDRLGSVGFNARLYVADKLLEAKRAYELSTGTGHGQRQRKGERVPPFREYAAAAWKCSPSAIAKRTRIAALDPQSRKSLALLPELTNNQAALLRLVRSNLESRHAAIVAFEEGGAKAFNANLRKPTKAKPKSDSPKWLVFDHLEYEKPITLAGTYLPTFNTRDHCPALVRADAWDEWSAYLDAGEEDAHE